MRASGLALLLFVSAAFPPSSNAGDARLVLAVKAGDKAAVSALLQQKADVNAPEPDGTTALHWATRADDLELADRLIRAGADVKAVNRYGVTAVYLAGVNGSAAMLEKLLQAGADANSVSSEGETILMTAARTGNVQAAKVLLEHGAMVDVRENWQGQTALMWATSQNHPDMVKLLIAHGADVNARSRLTNWERQNTLEPRAKWMPLGGLPAAHYAARDGCDECVALLAAAGADLNARDADGITPLIFSIINGHYDVAGALVESRADVNLVDDFGRGPLLAAVDAHTMPASNRPSPREIENELASLDLIRLLVSHGADVNAALSQSIPLRTKLDRGTDGGLGAGTTPLLRAAKAADFVVAELLLAKGADPQVSSRSGNPLLSAADPVSDTDIIGRYKTEDDIIQTVRAFAAAGVDINAADGSGRTALHMAAQAGFNQLVQFLADHGANLTARDSRGNTALDVALGASGGGRGAEAVTHQSTAALLGKLMGPSLTGSPAPQP